MKNVRFETPEETVETLRLATEAACLGIWDLNVRTGELHWSERTKLILGVTEAGPFTLKDLNDRIHPADVNVVIAAMKAATEPGGSGEYDIEYRVCRPDHQERHVHSKGKAFFEEVESRRTATRFVGTLLDRTEQTLAQAALVQAEQLAATGRLAASIAHEINNPLESVTNLLYLLRDEPDAQARREYLRTAESEMARVSEIASNTLRFYQDPAGITPVQLSPLTKSVLSLFHGRLIVRGITVDMRCEEDAEVLASRGELRQVLVNLVGNALDAMPEGGRLRVRCRRFKGQIGSRLPGVGICIADNGAGMKPEVLKRAFEAFYTTKGSKGTGLGLWLSLGILKKHGFKLLVKSKLEHGTVFSILMPTGAPTAI